MLSVTLYAANRAIQFFQEERSQEGQQVTCSYVQAFLNIWSRKGKMDWELANKRALCDMVLVYAAITRGANPLVAAEALYRVHCCRAVKIPSDLPKAFNGFVSWVFHCGGKPSWYKSDNGALSPEQKEACLIAGDLLMAAKKSVEQAAQILHENGLGDLS